MRSATPLRNAFESVLATARRSMSIACTCSAPLRASWIASSPVPQPMSRQRRPCAEPLAGTGASTRRSCPGSGRRRRARTTISGISSGNSRRPAASSHGCGAASGAAVRREAAARGGVRRRRASVPLRRPSGWSRTRSRAAAMCSGRVPQQPPMICAPSARQCDGHLGVLVAVDGPVEAPAVGRVVAEVRIDAERQVGEVPQPREHPGHVVGRQAVDEQRPDPDLLEVVGGAAELVALRAAPVLAEHAAHAVAAAAEADPDGDPARARAPRRRRTSSPSRTSVIVSSRTRSGGSSSNARGSSSSISLRASLSTSPLMLNASAASPVAAGLARSPRAPTRRPRRAMSIQCTGVENAARARRSSSPVQPPRVRRDHVAAGVEVARGGRRGPRRAGGRAPTCPRGASSSRGVASGRRRPSSVAMPPSSITQRCWSSSSSSRP